MDWALAIKRNRAALLRILAALFALAGLEDGQSGPARAADGPLFLPRHLHAYVLRISRAAESAIRRLIVIAAREVAVQPCPTGGFSLRNFGGKHQNVAAAPIRIPAFPLLDPLRKYPFEPPRRASKFMPRICVVGFTEPAPLPQKPVLRPDDPVDAAGICRRLLASRRALENLPAQARRLARWQARRRLRQGPGRVVPLRFGRPPGGRKRPIHVVDDILKECHALALDVLSPDTS
ncbi:MAG: hypothetical protein WDZ83_11805 [Rhizobiaceae bacterium]